MNWIETVGGAGLLAAGSYALYSTFDPRGTFWGKVICKSRDGARRRVSITFDDGPTAGCTDAVLDALGEANVRATFFVIGRNVRQCPELVRRMDSQGHLVANHTFDHGHFGVFRAWKYWREQLRRTDELIAQTIGKKPALFRPPMGITTQPIHYSAKRGRQTVVTWSRRARDGVETRTEDILARVNGAEPGDILMLHDGVDPNQRNARHRDRSATIGAIRPMIDDLRRRDLEPVRLDELLGIAGYGESGAHREVSQQR